MSVESSESPLIHGLESESSSALDESPQARMSSESNPLPLLPHDEGTTTSTAVQSLATGATASQENPLSMPHDCNNRLSPNSSSQSDIPSEQQER